MLVESKPPDISPMVSAPALSAPWHGVAIRTHASALPSTTVLYLRPTSLSDALINKVLCEEVKKNKGSRKQSWAVSGGLNNSPKLYKSHQLYPSTYAHRHDPPGQPGLYLPRTQWAGLWLANGMSFLRDSVIQLGSPMAHPDTQNGQNTALMWGEAIPEPPTPSEGLEHRFVTQHRRCACVHVHQAHCQCFENHLHKAEQVWLGEWWGCEPGQVLSSNPIRA